MDTNHMAHRYRHTEKEAHLLSEPSELQPLKAMAHRYTEKEAHLLSEPSELQPLKAMAHQYRHTGKEAHLLSGPSGLQPSEDSETQKFRSSTQVRQPRQEYSRFTETEKAKFQTPFTYNDERNFVRHNSVNKFSPNLVYMTTSNTSSVSNFVFFRKKGRKCRYCRRCTCSRRTCTCTGDSRQNDHILQEQESQRRTLGSQPASTHSDFYIQTLSRPRLVDTQYNVGLYEHL